MAPTSWLADPDGSHKQATPVTPPSSPVSKTAACETEIDLVSLREFEMGIPHAPLSLDRDTKIILSLVFYLSLGPLGIWAFLAFSNSGDKEWTLEDVAIAVAAIVFYLLITVVMMFKIPMHIIADDRKRRQREQEMIDAWELCNEPEDEKALALQIEAMYDAMLSRYSR